MTPPPARKAQPKRPYRPPADYARRFWTAPVPADPDERVTRTSYRRWSVSSASPER